MRLARSPVASAQPAARGRPAQHTPALPPPPRRRPAPALGRPHARTTAPGAARGARGPSRCHPLAGAGRRAGAGGRGCHVAPPRVRASGADANAGAAARRQQHALPPSPEFRFPGRRSRGTARRAHQYRSPLLARPPGPGGPRRRRKGGRSPCAAWHRAPLRACSVRRRGAGGRQGAAAGRSRPPRRSQRGRRARRGDAPVGASTRAAAGLRAAAGPARAGARGRGARRGAGAGGVGPSCAGAYTDRSGGRGRGRRGCTKALTLGRCALTRAGSKTLPGSTYGGSGAARLPSQPKWRARCEARSFHRLPCLPCRASRQGGIGYVVSRELRPCNVSESSRRAIAEGKPCVMHSTR